MPRSRLILENYMAFWFFGNILEANYPMRRISSTEGLGGWSVDRVRNCDAHSLRCMAKYASKLTVMHITNAASFIDRFKAKKKHWVNRVEEQCEFGARDTQILFFDVFFNNRTPIIDPPQNFSSRECRSEWWRPKNQTKMYRKTLAIDALS